MLNINYSTFRSVAAAVLILGSLAVSGLMSVMTSPASPIDPVPASRTSKPEKPEATAAGVVSSAPEKSIDDMPQAIVAQADRDAEPVRTDPAVPRAAVPGPMPAAGVAPLDPAQPKAFGVRLASDGLLPGRLNILESDTGNRKPATKLTINFLKQGKIVAQVKPGVAGVFQVKDLVPGVYSMVATGQDGFFASTILVLPTLDPKSAEAAIEDPSTLQIDADVIHPASVPIVRMMIRERLFPSASAAVPPAKALTEEAFAKHRGRPLTTPILLASGGTLKARLNWVNTDAVTRSPAEDTVAYLIRDGVIAAKSEIDAQGICRFTGVTAGSYALLVAPQPTSASPAPTDSPNRLRRGYAAMGVIVANAPAEDGRKVETPRSKPSFRFVSAVRVANEIDVADVDLVPIEDIESSVSGTMEGSDTMPAGLAGAPPAKAPPGGGGGGGGSDGTPLLFGAGIAGLIAAGANQGGSSNVSATAIANGGGGGNGDGNGPGGSPKSAK